MVGLSLALLPVFTGCTSTQQRPKAPVPIARTTTLPTVPLGNIGVVVTSTIPTFECRRPHPFDYKGKAEAWAEKCFWLGANPQDAREALAGLPAEAGFIILPMAAAGLVGRLAGDFHDGWTRWVAGLPQDKLAAADTAINKVITETYFQELLRNTVGNEARRKTSIPVTVVKKPVPQQPDQEFADLSCIRAGTLAWVPPGETPRSYLAAQNIDTMMEIRVHEHGLEGKAGYNPKLRMVADLEVRLVRLQDGAELCKRRLRYQSESRKYTDWADAGAQALRVEISVCCASLATQMVAQILPESDLPDPGTMLAGNFDTTPQDTENEDALR